MPSSLKKVVKGHCLVAIGPLKGLTALVFVKAHLLEVLDLVVNSQFTGVVLGPLGGLSVELFKIVLEHLGDDRILRIIWLRGTQECLE